MAKKTRTTDRPDTRSAIFQAAASSFSARGFDGVGVDDIATQAQVNKAMIYYHFTDKLALYRAVVSDMLLTLGESSAAIAASNQPPEAKLDQFIANFMSNAEARPWFPTMMLREMSEGAPHLDLETFGLIRNILLTFGRILSEGAAAGTFRPIHPVLAYTSVVGPLLMNAARERMAAQPGRSALPMFVEIAHADLVAHIQDTARRMLQPR